MQQPRAEPVCERNPWSKPSFTVLLYPDGGVNGPSLGFLEKRFSNSPFARIAGGKGSVPMNFNLKIALLGLITLSAGVNLAGCQSNKACCGDAACADKCAAKCETTPVAIADVPAPVMSTIQREAPGASITRVGRCEMGGKACYCAEVASAGRDWLLCIDGDGTLTKKELMK